MKNRLYITILLLSAFMLNACSDWFDISPKTDVKAEELFETENGFLSSLAGIYVLMTDNNLYGGEMSYNLIEQLVQMYDYIPDGAGGNRTAIYNYTMTTGGGYNTKGRMANIWLSSYNIIANANNLLKWLDVKGEDVISNNNTRNMLRGEALAIRAHMHFELLRCWGPVNYAGNSEVQDTKCIPYRKVTDASKQPLLAASNIVTEILSDLKQAKECLSYESDLDLNSYNGIGRRFRFNYHAINALMARVYNYMGEYELARDRALDVIDNCGLELQNGNDKDPMLFSEVICGVNVYNMVENVSSYFEVGDKIDNKYYITYATMNALFDFLGVESSDMRTKNAAFERESAKQMAISRKYIENDNEVVPLIRLPEMYYIVAESYKEGSEASHYINMVRNKRGISSVEDVFCNTFEDCIEALNDEYRKEFYAEGQYFYFLKTHGIVGELVHCSEVILGEEQFVFPLPDNEKEYGWVEDEVTDDTQTPEEGAGDDVVVDNTEQE